MGNAEQNVSSIPHWRESFDVVAEAAVCGAEAHVGPSDISTADYEALIERAVESLEEKLEARDDLLRRIYENERVWRVLPRSIAADLFSELSHP